MSNAAVLIRPHGEVTPQFPEWIPSPDAAGLSIVLLHPAHITGKVQREFAQVSGMNVPFFAQGCRRYSIRRYPSHQSAGYVAGELLGRGLEESWLAGVVLQEIYDAEATGIVRRLGEDFIVELAVGHFVPKGSRGPFALDHLHEWRGNRILPHTAGDGLSLCQWSRGHRASGGAAAKFVGRPDRCCDHADNILV